MIRVCRLEGQIFLDPAHRQFALYDTVVDRFVTVYDSQTWESADKLQEDFDCEIDDVRRNVDPSPELKAKVARVVAKRDRCIGLARGSGY